MTMSPWQEWKEANAEKQLQGKTSPIDFLNPDTEFATDEVSTNRLNTCEKCPNFMVTKQCKLCMCVMPFKVKLQSATCPESRWS